MIQKLLFECDYSPGLCELVTENIAFRESHGYGPLLLRDAMLAFKHATYTNGCVKRISPQFTNTGSIEMIVSVNTTLHIHTLLMYDIYPGSIDQYNVSYVDIDNDIVFGPYNTSALEMRDDICTGFDWRVHDELEAFQFRKGLTNGNLFDIDAYRSMSQTDTPMYTIWSVIRYIPRAIILGAMLESLFHGYMHPAAGPHKYRFMPHVAACFVRMTHHMGYVYDMVAYFVAAVVVLSLTTMIFKKGVFWSVVFMWIIGSKLLVDKQEQPSKTTTRRTQTQEDIE